MFPRISNALFAFHIQNDVRPKADKINSPPHERLKCHFSWDNSSFSSQLNLIASTDNSFRERYRAYPWKQNLFARGPLYNGFAQYRRTSCSVLVLRDRFTSVRISSSEFSGIQNERLYNQKFVNDHCVRRKTSNLRYKNNKTSSKRRLTEKATCTLTDYAAYKNDGGFKIKSWWGI